MIFNIDHLNTVKIIPVLFILGFQHGVHLHKLSFRVQLPDPGLVGIEDCETHQIDDCSDIENIRGIRSTERSPRENEA